MTGLRIPIATYRLQFHAGFGFRDATALAPYLARLGISELYASPILQARQGSSHGYDVTDITRLNPALGSEEDFAELVAALQEHGMGLLLDFVPNHMAAAPENPWWMDVLTYGPGSPYRYHFDIDWFGGSRDGTAEKLMIPVLGGPYGQVLEDQELQLVLEDSEVKLRYWEHVFPLHPHSYGNLLRHGRERLKPRRIPHTAMGAFESLLHSVEQHSILRDDSSARAREHRRQGEGIRQAIRSLCDSHPVIRTFLEENIRFFNGSKGDPASFDALDALLNQQVYRLAYWRRASEAINYRRFFDINDLVGMRVNEPDVFHDMHERILVLARQGAITGLRLDHIDGLYDPLAYLRQLQASLADNAATEKHEPGFFVIVEKIVGRDETIPPDWPVHGTTGYEFLNNAQGVFVDHIGLRSLNRTYARFTRSDKSFGDVVYECKKQVLRQLFSGEMQRFGVRLKHLAATDRYARDLPEAELERGLREVTACFPVYRTFTRTFEVAEQDLAHIETAVDEAGRRTTREEVSNATFDFIRRVLELSPLPREEQDRNDRLAFVRKWQQFTGPVTAKGLEDTAFYRHNRLISLNAVGGDVQEVEHPVHVDGFHRFNQARLREWPYSLNATSTHDTKRSGDVEMRINVISELPRTWARRFHKWSRMNAGWRHHLDGRSGPDAQEEIFLYQTLLGVWPLQEEEKPEVRERIKAVVRKALREEKVHTDWLSPNLAYEEGVLAFVDAILQDRGRHSFLRDFEQFQRWVSYYGAWNALGQVVLKITSPGIPDFYQGNEIWDFSLVDPDNRRPVDFQYRSDLLDSLLSDEGSEAVLHGLTSNWQDGRIKLFTTYKALQHRQRHAALYLHGTYLPLEPAGARSRHLCAFARHQDGKWIIAVIPRLTTGLTTTTAAPIGKRVWGGNCLRLPPDVPKQWRNIFTGETVVAATDRKSRPNLPVEKVLARFPVAILAADS